MIQLDTFLAYGFAATLASLPRQAEPSTPDRQPPPDKAPTLDSRFAITVLWLAVAFAPQAVYLMWRFPAWESMYVYLDHDSIPAWLAAAVPISIVIAGSVAFVLTRWLRARGRNGVARALMIASFAVPLVLATLGWDGTGYRRLLCAAGPSAWLAGEPVSIGAFLTSELALTLLWLEGALLVPYGVMMVRWRQSRSLARDARAPLNADSNAEVRK